MTKTVKIILISALSLVMAGLVFYCVRFGRVPEGKAAGDGSVSTEDAMQAAAQLASAAETARQNGTAKHITLSDDGSIASASDVQIQGNTVKITASGIYRISGLLTEGQLEVDCDGMVVLILDDVEIANSLASAIKVSNADHILIYLSEDSINKLVSGTEQEITAAAGNADVESSVGAALYARDNLFFAGSGKLIVDGYINNAVATTDHLIILGGELELAAVNNGLKGKDSVTILDGKITINSGNDGIKSGNDVDADCGNIDIRGGDISIVSFGDGIQAEKNLSVEDGNITIAAGDITELHSEESFEDPLKGDMNYGFFGAPDGMDDNSMPPGDESLPEKPDGAEQGGFPGNGGGMGFPGNDRGMGFQGNRGGMGFPGNQGGTNFQSGDERGQGGMRGDFSEGFDQEKYNDSGSAASMKGLKSGGDLTVSGGSITVDSVDDCIHANGSITVTGGSFLLNSGDDGFHADDTLTVSDGAITVSRSYEGLEGHMIYIDGGTITVKASDDGINAGGGSTAMFGARVGVSNSDDSTLPLLRISGGTLYVNADGDGLDSNGDLIVEGGNIIVDGPSSSGNGALDSGSENGGSIVCNGGTIIAIGASGMAETFEGNSTQCSFIKNLTGTIQAGTKITIADENGKVIAEHQAAKAFNSIVFSSPELVLGNTYVITVGDQNEMITIESISSGGSSGFNTPGGFGHKGRK